MCRPFTVLKPAIWVLSERTGNLSYLLPPISSIRHPYFDEIRLLLSCIGGSNVKPTIEAGILELKHFLRTHAPCFVTILSIGNSHTVFAMTFPRDT